MRVAPLTRLGVVLGVMAIALAAAAAASAVTGGYNVKPLVSDNGVPGTITDPNLVNSWGLVAGPTTPWWVADNGANVATLYNTAGPAASIVPLVVNVGDAPTGTVFNGTAGFKLANGNPARFLFDNESGIISGWNGGPASQVIVDMTRQGAVFKGLAIAATSSGPRLFATDFAHSQVDVFDASGNLVPQAFFQFRDFSIPRLFAPFGIQTIGSLVYVTYAERQSGSEDEAHGQGLGYVDAYDANTGFLVSKIAVRGDLNAPWGVARAPAGFGAAAGDILVGNFGDGTIHAFRPNGFFATPEGSLNTTSGTPIVIDGLWALEFGNGNAAGPTDSLFFTAGPNDEADGLFGVIRSAGP
jgi:uncharacterized protein (TIGR03118 family)